MVFMRIIAFKNYFSMKTCCAGVLGDIEKRVGFVAMFFKLAKI